MHCRWTAENISEYLEGQLSEEESADLKKHLQSCHSCRQMTAKHREMVADCRAMPALEMPREIWPELQCRLQHAGLFHKPEESAEPLWIVQLRQQISFYRRLAYSSLATCLLMAAVWAGRSWSNPVMPTERPAADEALTSLEMLHAEQHLQKAISSMSQLLALMEKDWSPEIRQVVDQNLKVVDRSIADYRAILVRDPQNQEAGTFLLAAYREKEELLKTLLEYIAS